MKKGLFFILIVSVLMVFTLSCAKREEIKPEPAKIEPTMVEPVRPEPVKAKPPKVIEKKEEVVREPIYPVEVAEVIPPQEKSLVELKDVLFDYDKYDIRPDAQEVLNSIAPWLIKNTVANVLIEGHCDERGTNDYNLALGERRAIAVKNYLISKGIIPQRLTTISYGEEKPICLEHNEDCYQRNRRARFVVTK